MKTERNIYTKINFWIASKAFDVVNSFLAQRAKLYGYNYQTGKFDKGNIKVYDWKTFEELMLDIKTESYKEQDTIEYNKGKKYDAAGFKRTPDTYENDKYYLLAAIILTGFVMWYYAK